MHVKKWIAFLILPTLITYALGFVIDLVLGHSISMNVYCGILGVIYGLMVFSFAPYQSVFIATFWLIGSCMLDLYMTYGEPNNPSGSPFHQNVIKGIVSLITAWLCLIGSRNQARLNQPQHLEYEGDGSARPATPKTKPISQSLNRLPSP